MKNKILHKIITSVAATLLFVGGVVSISSCGKPSFVDYTHNGAVKLKLDYKNHNFFDDGIGQVTVFSYIDGDTTHFKCTYGDTATTLKSRYYGIDTPESTGAIQPYGKQASNFTHEKLANAAENGTIVVSSPFSTSEDGSAGRYGKPETDSTGSRYLSLIWINETVKNAPVESLVLLNLWIVQEGLSWAKNTAEVPAYRDTFSNAQNQAEAFKLKLWSGQDDPLFNYGEYETTSLYDIKQEILEFFKDHDHVNKFHGANIRFTGVVAGYSDHVLYVQERYIFDKETGEPVDPEDMDQEHPEKYIDEWAGINIFCGMSGVSASYTEVGTYLEICGTASDSENFGFQVAGCIFPPSLNYTENDCKVLLTAEQNDGVHALKTFTYTAAQLDQNIKAGNFENLYCRTVITDDLVCNDAYVNDKGDEATVYYGDHEFNSYVPFSYLGNQDDPGDSWMYDYKLIGRTYKAAGVMSYHKSSSGNISYQLIACGHNDLLSQTPTKGTVTAEPYTVEEMVNDGNYIKDVTYYALGKVGQLVEDDSLTVSEAYDIANAIPGTEGKTDSDYLVKGTVKTIDTEWDAGYKNLSYTITDGTKNLKVYRSKASGIDGSKIKVNDSVYVKGNLQKYTYSSGGVSLQVGNGVTYDGDDPNFVSFTLTDGVNTVYVNGALINSNDPEYVAKVKARIIAGSTVKIHGRPVAEGGKVNLTAAAIDEAYLHGQYIDDPLRISEANTIALALRESDIANKKYYASADQYYIEGTVKSVTEAYDASSKRISFIITDGVNDYLITGSKMGTNPYDPDKKPFDYNLIQAGTYVKVVSKLLNDKGTPTTYYNGCQVVDVAV